MATSSSNYQQLMTTMATSTSSQIYKEPMRTLLTPVNKLEVLCELMVDFDSMAENGFDFRQIVRFQGWTKYFERLVGPVFPILVKEFWIHAQVYPKFILSSVMGKAIVITEKLICQLIGCDDVVVTPPASRVNLASVYLEIFTSGFHSNKIRDLKPPYKIWAKIFLGCIFHRKPSNSPDYINNEQLYLLYCIGKDFKVDLPHLLFDHLWNHVKETREKAKSKSLKIRDWIPMGRLISDILTENGLVAHLTEAGQTDELKAIVGKLVEKLQYEPVQMNSETVRTRRVPVEDFPLFTAKEPRESLLAFI